MAGKLVKSATGTIGTFSGDLVSVPAGTAWLCEAIDVTTLGSTHKEYAASPLKDIDEMSATFYADGSETDESVGKTVYSFSITVTDGTNETLISMAGDCIVTGIKPGSVEADGDRKATVEITFKPLINDSNGNS